MDPFSSLLSDSLSLFFPFLPFIILWREKRISVQDSPSYLLLFLSDRSLEPVNRGKICFPFDWPIEIDLHNDPTNRNSQVAYFINCGGTKYLSFLLHIDSFFLVSKRMLLCCLKGKSQEEHAPSRTTKNNRIFK